MSGFAALTLGELRELLPLQPEYHALTLRGAGETWWDLDMRVEDELLMFFVVDTRESLRVSTALDVLDHQFSHLAADTPLAFHEPSSLTLCWVVGQGGRLRDADGLPTVRLGF